MTAPSLARVVPNAPTASKPAANAGLSVKGAPGVAQRKAPDVFKDALTLSTPDPLQRTVKVKNSAEDDDFGIAAGSTGLVDQLKATLSKGALGVGLNFLVVGGRPRNVAQRHVDLAGDIPGIADPANWTMGGVYRFTSLLQQVAVFWRTMGNAVYKSGTWLLSLASRLPVVAPVAARSLQAVELFAASPAGRTLSFLNKWVPLLNAAWILMALKTSVDVFRNEQSSTTSKAVSVTGVVTSTAAVAAGFFAPGIVFLGVTALSIFSDLLLVETRYRDARHGDADALATRFLTRPWEGVAAGGRWMKRISQVIGSHLGGAWDKLTGKKHAAPQPAAVEAAVTTPTPAPAPRALRPAPQTAKAPIAR